MIEKKFRAWDKESKMMSNTFDINGLPKFKDREYLEVVSSRFILMQYIGKKDRNNKEVCEDDILAIYYKTDNKYGIGIVKYDEEYCCYYTINKDGVERFMEYDFEIIGNKYENPELWEEINNATK